MVELESEVSLLRNQLAEAEQLIARMQHDFNGSQERVMALDVDRKKFQDKINVLSGDFLNQEGHAQGLERQLEVETWLAGDGFLNWSLKGILISGITHGGMESRYQSSDRSHRKLHRGDMSPLALQLTVRIHANSYGNLDSHKKNL